MKANKGSERNQIHKKKLPTLCQSLNLLLLEWLFLASLYSFSSKPGRFKEKEKLEISSMMWVKELTRKILSSQIQVLKCCSWLCFWTSAFLKDFLSMLFYGRWAWQQKCLGISYHWSRNVLLVWHRILPKTDGEHLFIYLFPLDLFNIFSR